MGLTDGLRRFATARPHVLLVEGAASVRPRLAVERFVREQGWPLVDGPADADILVAAGRSGGPFLEYVDRLWEQLPGPRARVQLSDGEGAAPALLEARRMLADVAQQRGDVRRTERPSSDMSGMDMESTDPHAGHDMSHMDTESAEKPDPHAGHDMSHMDAESAEKPDPHAGHDMSHMDAESAEKPDPHAGHDMSHMDAESAEKPDPHAGHDMSHMDAESAEKPDPHAGHDMSHMDTESADKADPHAGHDMSHMDMPAGLAMAERAPDRDGLKLDVLTVPWGPVLTWWPAGLVVTAVLQGDVVQEVRVEQLVDVDASRAEWSAALAHLEPAAAVAVVRLDALVRLLAVAGWEGARQQCQQVRDALLSGARDVAVPLHRLSRKVQRSRTLRQMTTGVWTTREEDVAARYRRWLDEAVAAVDGGKLPVTADEPHAVHVLPALLVGSDIAAARLVVATLELALSGADIRPVAGV